MGYAAAEIAPVVTRLRETMLASTRIFADETVVPVLDPGRGRTKPGYFWAIARDDRPWGGNDPPAVVYNYAPGRGHTHANALLGGYRGILRCDGYAAYKKLAGSRAAEPSITLAFCWSHVRRGFYDLAKTKAPIAIETLKRIATLHEIEERVRGKTADDRLTLRRAESKPLVADLRAWFEAQIEKLAPRCLVWVVTNRLTSGSRLFEPTLTEGDTAQSRRKGRFAPRCGGLRPSLTATLRGVTGCFRPGRRNGPPAEQRNWSYGSHRPGIVGSWEANQVRGWGPGRSLPPTPNSEEA